MSFPEEAFDQLIAERAPHVVRSTLTRDQAGSRIGVVLFNKPGDTPASTPGLDVLTAIGEEEADVRVVRDVEGVAVGVTPGSGKKEVFIRVPEGTVAPFVGSLLLLDPVHNQLRLASPEVPRVIPEETEFLNNPLNGAPISR